MLPDFRFLFAAIVLSMSILVFGLGAAALLRAAHEEFASTPAWHPPQETVFAQQADATGPVLAMLRVDPPAVEQKAPDDASPAAALTHQPAIISTPPETERIAALQPQDPLPSETAKPDIPVVESAAQNAATPAPAASPEETKIAASAQALPPASEAAPAAPEQTNAPAATDINIAATKTAALGSPAVTIEAHPPAKPAVAKHEKNAIRKARRANRNHRLALRARVVQHASQQPADPFAQVTARRR